MIKKRGTRSSGKTNAQPTSRTISLILLLLLVIAGLVTHFWQSSRRPGPEPAPPSLEANQLEIHALDVGQGDSFLIITPEGKTILIDAGPPETAEAMVESLRREGAQQIDLIVATHPHADHIGGMRKLLDALPVKMFLDSGQTHSSKTFTRMLEKIRDRGITFVAAEAGQEFEFDNGIVLHLLAPIKPFITGSRNRVLNANSIVARLTYGSFSMLFTGDSERETEKLLLERYPDLSSTVLKVAHHGSRYASRSTFLKRVQPEVAIVSCGEDNRYGHPAQSTLDRLRKVVPEVYRTDLQGQITIYTDGKSYTVETEHPASADVWAGREPSSGRSDDRSMDAASGGGG